MPKYILKDTFKRIGYFFYMLFVSAKGPSYFLFFFFYLFAIEAFVFTIFILGNFQNFLENSLSLLFHLLKLLVSVNLITGLFSIFYNLLYKKRPLFNSFFQRLAFSLILSLNLILYLLLHFFATWLNGQS